ncbi:myrosinase 1-like [Hyposmocoma kahamanoa]|uniref:myrosinase 1-like n=1 Tax=Hyposmocoma kahamanoa TaxID=1477025 RepID=UPI000E6D963F|nr:myrosinase 1-like [Hyposmocoma kahamanoa]
MSIKRVLVFCLVLGVCWCGNLDFPPGFKFGAATSAYQIEGAWNASDKHLSVWDFDTQSDPKMVRDGNNGDTACDSYNLYKRDVEMAKELGLHFYRFSISWPRLMPASFPIRISEDGKRYYNDLIDELLKNNIEPIVTLYHWDLPQRLQNLGGWANPLIADWFADYARVAYSFYGDRVKTWITINEPIVICDVVYNTGLLAPRVQHEDGALICNKNVLLAHAKAWRVYDEEFKPKYHGKVSMANQMVWLEAASKEDEDIAILAREHSYGRYTHPVFSREGGWPAKLERAYADISKKQGYLRSKLPAFTKKEIEYIRGTYDFLALNHYTSRKVRKGSPGESATLFTGIYDFDIKFEVDESWKNGSTSWFYVYPEGIRKQINWLKQQYGDVEIFITENGYCDDGDMVDDNRVEYYKDYLKQVLLAIKEDKAKVIGYTAWSMMDNFEWIDGYQTKFGLYKVDFDDPERTRTPRKSAKFYADVIKHNSLDIPESQEL